MLKFTIVSPRTLPFPITVWTLSGVSIAVAKRPISLTVPVTPPIVTKSPTLNGSQHDQERARREVAEETRPGHADRHAGAGEERRERRRLHPEVAEDADHQDDVQRDRDDRAGVAQERRVDLLPFEGPTNQPDGNADEPPADHPKEERADHLEGDGRQEHGDGLLQLAEVDRSPLRLDTRSPLRSRAEWPQLAAATS